MKLYEYQRSRSFIDRGPNLSDSTFLNFFSSVIEATFHMESLWDGGMKVCLNDPGHMTKMAAICPYMVKTFKIFFSGTERPMTLKLGMQHRILDY